MHHSVFKFFFKYIQQDDLVGKHILEIGSYDVNGTIGYIVKNTMNPAEYIGTDMREGPRVDLVVKAEDLLQFFPPERFDVIICTEMLEHAKEWKKAVMNMKHLLKPDGILFVTTRSAGFPMHDYPDDYWRFSVEDFETIFADFNLILYPDNQFPGVLMVAYKPSEWTPANAIDLTDIEVQRTENTV